MGALITRVRKRRMNPDGSYDIIHYETNADLVLMSDGRNLAQVLEDGELPPSSLDAIVRAVLEALPVAEGVSY